MINDKMKNRLKFIVLAAVASMSLCATAQNTAVAYDTIYFYKTWEQMFDLQPTAYIVNPIIFAETPFEIYIETGYDETNQAIEKDYLALSQGDSIFLINSNYIKDYFKGDVKGLNGFIPIFFNDKVAYLTANGPLTAKDILFGNDRDGVTSYTQAFYYLDFMNRTVKHVSHSYLSELLTDYHDLKMRYEGMKNYKKKEIIQDYFYKYIDRATEDFMRPYILDLVGF